MDDEQPFFFTRAGAQLFGMLHLPRDGAPKKAFVMSHPFGEEKLWAHRVYVSFARALAGEGYAVLRFDYMGAGDSSGVTSDTSLDSHLVDLKAAVLALRERCPAADRVGLVGLRLGASVAALLMELAQEDPALAALSRSPLILWDPVLNGESYFQELLRSNLSTQLAVYGKVQETREVLVERLRAGGTVNVDGYEIGPALFASCGRPALLGSAKQTHAGPVLVLQIVANDTIKDRDDLRSLTAGYGTADFARAVEQPFWREIRPFYGRAPNLQQTTLRWLEKHGA
jgi:exosortase A-associated hydrolase 2